ncbi:NrfD/PsrC family molybdoenzyme membrane anchor subunit [Candidatus Venteria ishoeyi]|uniref:Polysulphide reductase, NrfD n=1 Tax=Candidatus Venteria ishoeyi TaxID=1899563 RepID=A0A1H6FHB3_9GAMM|nr:NrfD/PsrC family molybdoenzyme membrane anchor subunit [Candidatus Venteria ishoeyi]MDM8547562.1 polysulfide reductase NrfD [Candidatus Venteria ishoeyi]SEH08384.1 Polysulphide reductase%2C NrfD [Candidatus Venteria ishoeyi]
MRRMTYSEIEGKGIGFYLILGVLGAIILMGLGAVYHMEHEGHYVTGMSNQVVWGLPHIFAIFLIVAASGVLNIASIGTVFRKAIYKPLGRLSALMAITLLLGGLMILVLDLGHPDRLIIAMTSYNFKSIFAWNIILYNGFIAIVGVYLWFMMERRMQKYYPYAGFVAFIWRLILTTGTGSIFGFLVAREAYDAAILAPLFIVLSFSIGLAAFILYLMAAYQLTNRPLGDALLMKLKNLLAVFVGAVFYFVAIYHLTNLYITEQHGFESFILSDGGIYTGLFWIGYMLLGTAVPVFLLYCRKMSEMRMPIIAASVLVLVGGFSLLYVIIIGGQAYPLEIFPGKEVSSAFFDGVVNPYTPSIWEFMLGIAGVSVALIATILATRVLPFMPKSLADKDVDPHAA